MKNLFILILIVLVSFSFAQKSDERGQLKASHIAAMKYYGHSNLIEQKEMTMTFIKCENVLASALYSSSIATGYAEKENVKMYWFVERSKDGILVTLKINSNGTIYSRSFEVTITEKEMMLKNLNFEKVSASGFNVDWNCLMSKIPGCISCGTSWTCWLGCAGSAAWQCVTWREGDRSARFGCPKCDYDFYHYSHYCRNCGNCFSGFTCTKCYKDNWTNGCVCSRCGTCYK